MRRTTDWGTLQVCYEILITDHLEVDFGEDHQETDPHIIRIGWSMDRTSFQLGTAVHFVCRGLAQTQHTWMDVFRSSGVNVISVCP